MGLLAGSLAGTVSVQLLPSAAQATAFSLTALPLGKRKLTLVALSTKPVPLRLSVTRPGLPVGYTPVIALGAFVSRSAAVTAIVWPLAVTVTSSVPAAPAGLETVSWPSSLTLIGVASAAAVPNITAVVV